MNKIHNPKLSLAFQHLADEIAKIDSLANLDTLLAHLIDLPAYQACLGEIENDSVINQHFNKQIQFGVGGFRGGATDWLGHMISVVQAARRANDEQATIKNIYQDFEDFFYNDWLGCVALAPVQGLGVLKENETLRTATSRSYDDEKTPLILADDLQLAALDQSESVIAYQMEIVRRHHLRWSDTIYGIKVYFKVRKLFVDDDADSQTIMEGQADLEQKTSIAIEKIEEVLTTFRLYKPGRVLVGGILVKTQNHLFGNVNTVPYTLGNPFFDVQPYTIDLVKEGADLIRLHSVFVRAKAGSRKNLVIAARWLSRSSEADNLEDRVIALMIAAEALAQTGRRERKGDQIAAFIANLFPSESAEIENHLRRFYRLRNDIVHKGAMTAWIAKNLAVSNEVFSYIGRSAEIVRNALVIELEK